MKKRIKYEMPFRARLILEAVTVVIMLASPLIWIVLSVISVVRGLWDSMIILPLEVRHHLLEAFKESGIAKKIE